MRNTLETIAICVLILFLVALFISGIWAECTVTDPEYFLDR
jgi:hypothetical protein